MDLEKFKESWRSETEAKKNEEVVVGGPASDYYFNSYSHFGIHEEMLKDTVRSGTYQNAILSNRHLFEGKNVLDVGSGTGVLSLFAAKAGAKKVIGVEFSEIVNVARKIAEDNKVKNVTYVQGKVEEIELPLEKGEQVDIIISECMGYFLLYESMFDTVLFARDKWLKKDGLIFPDKARIYIAAIEDEEYKHEKLAFWDNVYGFDFRAMKKDVMEEPIVDVVDSRAVVTDYATILDLDLNTCTTADFEFETHFSLAAKRKDFAHAFVAWFDVVFSACHKPVVLSTAPSSKYTHWKQTVFYFDGRMVLRKGDRIDGCIGVRKNAKNPRDIDIRIDHIFEGTDSKNSGSSFYRLR